MLRMLKTDNLDKKKLEKLGKIFSFNIYNDFIDFLSDVLQVNNRLYVIFSNVQRKNCIEP